ncbi:OmpA family protein [Pectobacterium sp. B1J-3]|uniref:OmpA family protein n=1 Tax=Pectobacterium sp. B1J-3 TaxID=3385371 RepID=UPI003905B7ED
MSAGLQKLLWCTGAFLTLWLCLFFLPLSPAGKGFAFLATLGAATIAVIGIGRRVRITAKQQDVADILLALPVSHYRQPIVLVCGDGLPSLFGEQNIRETSQGCYLRVSEHHDLPAYGEVLLTHRPEWATQLSVLYVLNPQQHVDRSVLQALLRDFRYQLSRLSQLTGCSVPCLLCSYLQGMDSPWLEFSSGSNRTTVWREDASVRLLSEWIDEEGRSEQQDRFRQAIELDAWGAWLQEQVFPELAASDQPTPVCHPVAVSLCFVSQPMPQGHVLQQHNVWQQYIASRTTLSVFGECTETAQEYRGLPFPDAMLRLLPRQSGFTPRRRAFAYGVTMLTVFSVAALLTSAWSNHQLQKKVSVELMDYHAVAMNQYIAKAQHLGALKQEAEQLEKWHREGEPVRIGLGLYQGEGLRAPLYQAINGYVPPPQKEAVPVAVPELKLVAQPTSVVRLDSLSLFDVGQSRLKADSTKVLVSALMDIKAKPGWLILVAGHTDSTGNADANQALSLARAESVRNWMLETSDVPPTCFAVQGYGATRPVATNDTAAGRDANRRVEISLVPDAAACQLPASGSGSPPSSPVQATLHSK